jgi:hypothetical protein
MKRQPFSLTFGEFIDRLTIISKKAMSGLPGADAELALMMKWCRSAGIDGEFILAIIRVAQTNMSIWDLEHSVRNAAEGSISLAEVGRRSIMIRNTNRQRIEAKNILDRGTFVEEKIKHLSESTYDRFYNYAGLKYKAPTREEGGEGE